MKTVETAPHEFDANLLFDDAGLTPFFGFDSVIKDCGGSKTIQFRDSGEEWRARLSYQESGIIHPGETTPQGTAFEVETIREFRVKIFRYGEEDPLGQQSFTAHVAPRWQNMAAESNSGKRIEIPVPDGFEEGVNVRVQGSNIEFERYPDLFRLACVRLGINGRYFEEIHPFSNIQDAERYVRLDKDASGPVHARDGPIASMGHLLESDREGYRKVVQDDDDNRGNNLPGYYHTVTLGQKRIKQAFPDHKLPKEVKHYYAREAAGFDDDEALAHPKLGSSFQVSQMDDEDTLRFRDLDRLNRELEQTVLSVLSDAGLDVSPSTNTRPYFEGEYFTVEISHEGPSPVGLDMTRVRNSQESVVIRHVADGLNPTQWESLETLVTDGGDVSPEDIAESHERHVESVRRALRDMDEMVEREYGSVSLRSDYVAELVHDAVEEARDATRRAVETAGKAMDAAERGLDETMSAFVAWAARHGVDFDGSRDARMTLRFHDFDSLEETEKAIQQGFTAWKDAGMPQEDYRSAQVRFPDGSLADAWRFL